MSESESGSASGRLAAAIRRSLNLPSFQRSAADLISRCDPGATVLDIGCGANSPLGKLCGSRTLVGIDSHGPALDAARRRGTHDEYLQADVLADFDRVLACRSERDVQLVVLSHVIEHLPKRRGFELLDRLEELTQRFVLVETPNGFLPQGAEQGNEAQRHRSGWFAHDFEGLGYEVCGTGGLKWWHGYQGEPRFKARGAPTLEALIVRALPAASHPRIAFLLTAWKDVRGMGPSAAGQATAST